MLWAFALIAVTIAYYTDNYTTDMGWTVLVILLVLEFEAAIRKGHSHDK